MILLQSIIAIIFLYFTLHDINFKTVLKSISNVNYWFLVLALVPQGLSFLVLAAREKYLLKNLYAFSFSDLIKGVFISFVGNNILPLRAGEFLKAYYWTKRSDCAYVTLMSVALLERIFDLLVLVILFFIGSKTILLHLGVHPNWIIVLCVLAIAPILFLFLWDKKTNGQIIIPSYMQNILGISISTHLQRFLNNVTRGLRVLKSTRNMMIAVFFTLIYWMLNIAGLYFALLAFHLQFGIFTCIIILLATSFGTAIPSAPGYIGTYDYFAKMSLVLYGVNTSIATSFALISHALIIIPFTIVGLFFVLDPLQKILHSRKFNS